MAILKFPYGAINPKIMDPAFSHQEFCRHTMSHRQKLTNAHPPTKTAIATTIRPRQDNPQRSF